MSNEQIEIENASVKESLIVNWINERLANAGIEGAYCLEENGGWEICIFPRDYDEECCLVVSIDQSTDQVFLDYYWTPATMNPRLAVTFWYLLSHGLSLVDDVIFDVVNDGVLLLTIGSEAKIVRDGFSITC